VEVLNMNERTDSSAPALRTSERGFSLIEALIAAVLLLFVALSLVPVFTMAARSNVTGQDNTKAANFARERLEQIWALSLDDPMIAVTSGTATNIDEYYLDSTRTWTLLSGTVPASASWTRRTTIRNFTEANLTTPLPAASSNGTEMKEITVEVRSTRDKAGPFGGGKTVSILAYKGK
jgi:Tfp pilus assembly protein PilV